MELSKTFDPEAAEAKWYAYWLDNKVFSSRPNPDKEPYTIVTPPPNVTGILHMGHMLNNTIQDVLVRRARMQGKEACWVPGTDHASIATEAKVVAMLADQGIAKDSLTREDFLAHAWQWKEKYGGIILDQLKKLGCSCDWDRTRFTMEEDLSQAVIDVFVDLFNKGRIYRGVRMVNWDPQGLTAVSDEEVIHKEGTSKLYYIKYFLEGSNSTQWVTIATTRPETIMADVAIAVHPEDERFTALVGKKVLIPFLNRAIPVITDSVILKDFGTGCLKVTPAHDIIDYEIGQRHNLEVIDVLAPNGTLNDLAVLPQYVGKDRFWVRKQIAKDLAEAGHIEKEEEIKNNLGYSERTNAVIEPRLSMQWFLQMEDLAKPALDAVMNDDILLYPPKYKNTYRLWLENVKDWCISRQLWWGQRIPAYHLPNGQIIVANSADAAFAKAQELLPGITVDQLHQDNDVLDTWFSSWLWPISVFDGFKNPNNRDIDYYYPTNDLVTAPEILFFWVARMIIAGYEYRGEMPFKNVYLTGIVRDKQGRKMSKSLGNSPDPLVLIKQYGADGVRTGMLFSSPAGNDLPFDEKLCEQGRNFNNKIWNAFRLLKGWEIDADLEESSTAILAHEWFNAKLAQAITEIEDHFNKFRISDALLAIYKLIWDDFCSWYLELVKPPYLKPLSTKTAHSVAHYFDTLLRIAHPFMPFITEEIWQQLKDRADGATICKAQYPETRLVDESILLEAQAAFDIVTEIRNKRNRKGLSPKEVLPVVINTPRLAHIQKWEAAIMQLTKVDITFGEEAPAGATYSVVNTETLYMLFANDATTEDQALALTKQLDSELAFLAKVNAKLENKAFIANAKPEVIDIEMGKKEGIEAKIAQIKLSINTLA